MRNPKAPAIVGVSNLLVPVRNCNSAIITLLLKQGRAKLSTNFMSIAKTIIEQLDNMAKVALNPEDQERWQKTKNILIKQLAWRDDGAEALEQLRRYDGSDFRFERGDAPIEPGLIVYFQLGDMTPPIPAYIHARHEYSGCWKYNITLAVKQADGWHTTRLYNVESKWLKVNQ